jgi:hypothetical protein
MLLCLEFLPKATIKAELFWTSERNAGLYKMLRPCLTQETFLYDHYTLNSSSDLFNTSAYEIFLNKM